MNAEDLTHKLCYIQQSSGHTLNIEERAALQSSLPLLKSKGKFAKLVFWGKVYGIKKDYLIVQGFGTNLLKQKKSFCSYNGVDWVQLPDITTSSEATTRELSKKIRARFMGDLAHEYYIDLLVPGDAVQNTPAKPARARKSHDSDSEGDDDDDEEDAGQGAAKSEPKDKIVRKTVTEEKRLAHTIESIDFDTAMVPRGALTLDSEHTVSPNAIFQGLKGTQASQLRSYCHFRTPVTANKKSLLQKEGLSASLDFLDTLNEDIPRGCWSLQEDKYAPQVTIRSLLWPGFYFYHIPSTSSHGYVYFGFGEKNTDIGFML